MVQGSGVGLLRGRQENRGIIRDFVLTSKVSDSGFLVGVLGLGFECLGFRV